MSALDTDGCFERLLSAIFGFNLLVDVKWIRDRAKSQAWLVL